MKVTQSPTEFLVFHVLLTRAPENHAPEVDRWLRERAFGRAISPGPELDSLLASHPLTCRVAGFASAAVAFQEDAMVFDRLNAAIGPETQTIATAARILHSHRGDLLTYSGNLRALRLVGRRALLLGMPEKFVLGQVVGRSSDLADIAMQAGNEVTPPLDVVASILGLKTLDCGISMPGLREALRQGDHRLVMGNLVWTLEMIAKVYSATFYGDRLPVRWRMPASPTVGNARKLDPDKEAGAPEA